MTRRVRENEGHTYAGRWVARVRGKVVAQGETREMAYNAARASRPKEKIEVLLMSPIFDHPLIKAVQGVLSPNQPLYLVGGALRDSLMGRENHDLDFAVPAGAMKLARSIANALAGAYFPLDEENDTARVILPRSDGGRDTMDFAGFRGPDLEADLRGRDFTVNAIALDVRTGERIDPLGGAQDLREKRIRACGENSLSDDPLRILRAVRQAAALGFSIQLETRKLMKDAAPLLQQVSPERQRDELFKILEGPRPEAAIRALGLLGVFPVLLPELLALKGVRQSKPHTHDVWTHTLRVLHHLEGILAVLESSQQESAYHTDMLDGLLAQHLGRYAEQIHQHFVQGLNTERSVRSLLFFAALYHDIAKPQTKAFVDGRIRFLGHEEKGALVAVKRAIALRLSNDELDRLKLVILHHMRIHGLNTLQIEGKPPSSKAIYRFFRDTGEAGVDLVLLVLADTRATSEHTLEPAYWTACLEVCASLLEAWFDRAQEIVAPPQLVNGNDLMTELNIPAGRMVGELLELVREEQAAGNITTREEALNFARGRLAKPKA